MTREETVQFCNNPACDGCDVILRPQEVLRKGGEMVCPKCLEPLAIRRGRARPATLPFRPGSRQPPAAPAGKERSQSSPGSKL